MTVKLTIFVSLVLCVFVSCNSNSDSKNEIEIGEYILEFPKGFKLIPEKGFDSYVGKISNGKIDFQFDFGYYSNTLDKSIHEYVADDFWKSFAVAESYSLPGGDVTGFADSTQFLYYETDDSISYTLFYLHQSDTIDLEIKVPQKMLETKIEIDTLNQVIYKLVHSRDYAGLHAKNLNNYSKSMNAYKTLTLIVQDVNKQESELVLGVLRSCRLKK